MSATRVWEFLKMNPPEFNGSKVDDDPNDFIDKVYKVVAINGVCCIKRQSWLHIN